MLAVALALVAAGSLAAVQPQVRRIGVLALLVAVAWFAPEVEAADAAPLLRTLGDLLAPFALVLVAHIAVIAAGGRAARAVLAAGYALTAACTVVLALLRDPLLDLHCLRNCTDNVFLVHADPGLAEAAGRVLLVAALALGPALAAYAAQRLAAATLPGRRAGAWLLVPAALVGIAEASYAAALLSTPLEDPERAGFAAIALAREVAYGALAAGVAWSALRIPLARARVTRLAGELGEAPPPGRLRDALAAALGDPELDVVYPRDGTGELIDAEGRPAGELEPGRAVARITRLGRPLAIVLHDAAGLDERVLERAIGSAARLAVENEALRAETLAQIRELRDSRMRIVAAGDAERRRLERNLHDGAQQRLLALSYDLRRARAAAVEDGDEARAARLEAAGRVTDAALEELRRLARGIYPAILSEAGLGPALESLADEAPLPVELVETPAARLAAVAERTAYVALAEAIEDASARGASFVEARVAGVGDRLVLEAGDDGSPRAAPLEHLADRVGAVGGSLELGERVLVAEIPCGSWSQTT